MAEVFAQFEPGREWIMQIHKLPVAAYNIRQCKINHCTLKDGGVKVNEGQVFVESLRNNKGVMVSVALPTGYCFPTGRIAPTESWFPMLKAHIRILLASTPEGRIAKISGEGALVLEAQLQSRQSSRDSDTETEATIRKAIVKLRELQAQALGQLPRGLSEKNVLVEFYSWVTDAAEQMGTSQREVIEIIRQAIKTGQKVDVPDLDSDLLNRDFQRFLDI